jgi:predicted nucleotide-binding protein
MKPRMFVASSSKSRKLAHGIQANLDADTDVTCWDQGFFLPGNITLDALLTQAIEYDFGAFVFSPDDLVEMNSVPSSVVRDNVLFEFGLFAGKLGRDRS